MLTAFQTQKLTLLFKRMDTSCTGYVSSHDYRLLADRLALVYDIPEGSESRRQQAESLDGVWRGVAQLAGIERTGRLRLGPFLAAYGAWLANVEVARSMYDAVLRATVGFMSKDEEWKMSRREWVLNMICINMTFAEANAAFDRLDRDHDGYLHRSEMLVNIDEFFYSEDVNAPGNWFFGPLVTPPAG